MIQEADVKAIFFAFFLSNLQASSYDASMADQGERLKRLAVPRFRITLRNLHCEGTFGRVYSALYLHPETSREGQVLVKTVAGKRLPPPPAPSSDPFLPPWPSEYPSFAFTGRDRVVKPSTDEDVQRLKCHSLNFKSNPPQRTGMEAPRTR